MNKTIEKILLEIRSIFIIILIALSLRATIIEAYIVPTGSMENTIMTGDFLIGNKFAYGMRTPDWVGIPYTELGFPIPWTRFPRFKEIKQGDVVIFKYPRDQFQKYVKRCIAGPGQTIHIKNKMVSIDGEDLLLVNDGKFVDQNVFSSNVQQPGIFLRNGGNRDNLGPIRIPKKGDVIPITQETNWEYLIPIMIMDGHSVTLENDSHSRKFEFTMKDPNDIARRYTSGLGYRLKRFLSGSVSRPKKLITLFRKYYNQSNTEGKLLNVWNFRFEQDLIDFLRLDGKPFAQLDSYKIEQDYYWMMGDNRDDSADSRYWGFVPHELILGEALIVYMSWDFQGGGPRFGRIGRVIS